MSPPGRQIPSPLLLPSGPTNHSTENLSVRTTNDTDYSQKRQSLDASSLEFDYVSRSAFFSTFLLSLVTHQKNVLTNLCRLIDPLYSNMSTDSVHRVYNVSGKLQLSQKYQILPSPPQSHLKVRPRRGHHRYISQPIDPLSASRICIAFLRNPSIRFRSPSNPKTFYTIDKTC